MFVCDIDHHVIRLLAVNRWRTGITTMNWNDPDWLVKVAKITPYAFIILGGLVAVSGHPRMSPRAEVSM